MRPIHCLAFLAVGLLGAAPAEAKHLTMSTPWSAAECRNLEGVVESGSDGGWACCFPVIHQCWSCPVGMPTEESPCTCRGDSCPPEAKIGRFYREANRHEPHK
ncbi:MAG: hypothetical protein U1F33_01440 [Alphaproteobacteria bacterium]